MREPHARLDTTKYRSGRLYYASLQHPVGNSVEYFNVFYSNDILVDDQIPEHGFAYYLYLKSDNIHIDGYGVKLKDGCVGTIISWTPLRMGSTRFNYTKILNRKFRVIPDKFVNSTIIEMEDDNHYKERLRNTSLIDREIDKIKEEYFINSNYNFSESTTLEYFETPIGSYMFANLLKIHYGRGEVMAILGGQYDDFAYEFVWVDDADGTSYNIYGHIIQAYTRCKINKCDLLDSSKAISKKEYKRLTKYWANRFPNR